MVFLTSGFSVSPQAKMRSAPRVLTNSSSSLRPSVSALMAWFKDRKISCSVAESKKATQHIYEPPLHLLTSAASICCLMSEGSTPGSSSSLTISWESRSVLSSAATSAQNFPARSRTSFSLPSLSSARCRISSHRERRRRRRERTAGGGERGGKSVEAH